MRLGDTRPLTMATTSGLLTVTGAEALYDTTVAISFSIDGKAYSKATVADGAAITTDLKGNAFTALAADQGCVFVWCLNAAGTVDVAQGPIQAVDGATDLFLITPDFPSIDTGLWCPFAYSIHQTSGASSAWTFGTSNWNATGVTDIVVNVHTLPDRRPTDATA